MAYREIQLRSDLPAFSQRTTLDGVDYELSFRWNARLGRWIMDILDVNSNPILTGIVLLVNFPLTFRYIDRLENVPPGQFIVIDETDQARSPDRESLGVDIKLIYEEEGTA